MSASSGLRATKRSADSTADEGKEGFDESTAKRRKDSADSTADEGKKKFAESRKVEGKKKFSGDSTPDKGKKSSSDSATNEGETSTTGEEFEFFFGKNSPFSQHHPAKFVIDGVTYNCAEQYMMHQKAGEWSRSVSWVQGSKGADRPKTVRIGLQTDRTETG